MKNRFKTISGLLLIAAVIILFALLFPIISSLDNPEEFKEYLDSFGVMGFFLLLLVQVFQIIVAVIPGEVVEFLAGTVYGWLGGLFFCLLGIAIGQLIVFSAVRYFGKGLVEKAAGSKAMTKFKFLHNENRLKTVIFLLFFIPGTPKDLLTYFVPLTKIKPFDFIVITLVARIPSILTSTFAGDAFAESDIGMMIGAYAVILLLFTAGYVWYSRWNAAHKENDTELE